MNTSTYPGLSACTVLKVTSTGEVVQDDVLAVEEPLEIRIVYGPRDRRSQKTISVTMRTPGHDPDLAAGFLYTEGIVRKHQDIEQVISSGENIVEVQLSDRVQPSLASLDRHFYTTSSCGVCGKTSIEAVRTSLPNAFTSKPLHLRASVLNRLTEILKEKQSIFEKTGGLHASALFDASGNLLHLREDVGRHNALDKVAGICFLTGHLPLDNHVLLLSGRISFELVQKALMTGLQIVAAVGAPSSLALSLAVEHGLTLIGFLRDGRFNVYCGKERIMLNQ